MAQGRETQPQLARDHRRRGGLTEREAVGEDWLGYTIAVCMVLLFMILVGVLPVGQ